MPLDHDCQQSFDRFVAGDIIYCPSYAQNIPNQSCFLKLDDSAYTYDKAGSQLNVVLTSKWIYQMMQCTTNSSSVALQIEVSPKPIQKWIYWPKCQGTGLMTFEMHNNIVEHQCSMPSCCQMKIPPEKTIQVYITNLISKKWMYWTIWQLFSQTLAPTFSMLPIRRHYVWSLNFRQVTEQKSWRPTSKSRGQLYWQRCCRNKQQFHWQHATMNSEDNSER